MSKYPNRNPRHRKLARPALAFGAISVVTGLLLGAIAMIGGPIAPADAAAQAQVAGKAFTLVTDGDESSGDSPAIEGDLPESDPSLPPIDDGSVAPDPEAEQPEDIAPADSPDKEPSGEPRSKSIVVDDEYLQFSSWAYVSPSYAPPSYGTASVVIKKSASVESTTGGGSYYYTLTVTNPGSADAEGVVVSDPLPSDLTLNGTPTMPAGWTYTPPSPGGVQTPTFTRTGVLEAGITPQVFTIPVTVAEVANNSVIENTAKACAYNTTPACSTGTTYTAVSSLDVVVQAYCSMGAPYLHYDIATHNIDLAANPTLTLQWAPTSGPVEDWATTTLPSAATMSGDILWPGASVDLLGNPTGWPGWTLVGGVWTYDASALGADLLDSPRLIASIGLSASVYAEYPDLTGGCSGPPGIGLVEIHKTASVTATQAGESYDYTLSVTNPGTEDAHGVIVTDTLPIDLRLNGEPTMPDGWTFLPTTEDDGRDTLTFTLDGPLAAKGEPQVFTISVKVVAVPTVDSVENSAKVCAEDTVPACDVDTANTPVKSIDLVVASICKGDVPYLHYDIAIHNVDLVTHTEVSFEWSPAAGPVETWATSLLDAAPTMSGDILWPGAAVDGLGNATDWPGWSFAGGSWFFDPLAPGANLRDNARVTVSVNPSMTVTAPYPAATAACANPATLRINPTSVEGGSPKVSAISTTALPSAGVEAFSASAIALGSLALGFGLVLLYLSRRSGRQGR